MKSPTVFVNQAITYVKQVIQEGKKVIWPTQRDVMITSIMVCILSFIFAIFFLAVDLLLKVGVDFALGVGAHG